MAPTANNQFSSSNGEETSTSENSKQKQNRGDQDSKENTNKFNNRSEPDYVSANRYLAVNDALLMISYAAERGLDVKHEDIKSVLGFANNFDIKGNILPGKEFTVDEESSFWTSLGKISTLIKPATASAIRERTDFLVNKKKTAFSGTIDKYKFHIWVLLFCTLAIHAYYVALSSMIKESDDTLTHFVEERNELMQALATSQDNSPQFLCQAAEERLSSVELIASVTPYRWGFIKAKLSGVDETWKTELSRVIPECGNQFGLSDPKKYAAVVAMVGNIQLVQRPTDKIVNQAIAFRDVAGKFLLPLLYGTLGAIASVVRALSTSIREIRFSRIFRIEYGMQVPLGALAGATIGLVIAPETLSTVQGLTSLGLAFGLGYSVDVFFSFIDGFINRLTQPVRGSGTTP